MIHYQVNRCNQAGLRLLLLMALLLSTWQLLSPYPLEQASSINDKLGHGLLFLALAALADHAYSDKLFNWQKVFWLLSYGAGIEIIQSFIPRRDFSLLDIAADLAGILLYWLVIRFLLIRDVTTACRVNDSQN
ncbi:MAG: VanZ family protein [Chromatiales bacterium]